MDFPDPGQQPLVFQRPSRPVPGLALVIGGRRDAQGPANRLDPEMTATLVDERGHFGRSGSSSFAKKTDADFKISFARRSSKFSWRNRRISSRSAGRRQIRPLPGVGLVLAQLLAQRLRMDAEVMGDVRDRSLAFKREPDPALDELGRVFLRSGHRSGGSLSART
jgi:hypothetical protein